MAQGGSTLVPPTARPCSCHPPLTQAHSNWPPSPLRSLPPPCIRTTKILRASPSCPPDPKQSPPYMHLVALSLQCLQLFTDSKTGNFEVQCQLIVECGHSGGDENDEHDQHEHHDGEGQHSLVPNSRERQPGDLIGGSSATSSSKIEVQQQKQIKYYFLFKS